MWPSFIASALFFLVLVSLGGGWFLWRRRRLLGLFKVSRSNGIIIYLSRLQIVEGGAVGVDGLPRGFSGAAVTATEAAASSVLGSVFEYLIPGLENQPGLLKTLFTRDISVSVAPSPRSIVDLPNDQTIVAVGSPGYNSVSAWVQGALNPRIRFDDNNASMLVNGQQPVTDPTQGMVQVLWDANNSRRVFYVAGLSESGTAAGLLYLGRKWEELRKNLNESETYACFVRLESGNPKLLSTVH